MDPGFGLEWTGGGELVVRLDALPRHLRETRNSEAARRETMLNAFQQIQHNLDALASSKTSRSSSTMPRLPRVLRIFITALSRRQVRLFGVRLFQGREHSMARLINGKQKIERAVLNYIYGPVENGFRDATSSRITLSRPAHRVEARAATS